MNLKLSPNYADEFRKKLNICWKANAAQIYKKQIINILQSVQADRYTRKEMHPPETQI